MRLEIDKLIASGEKARAVRRMRRLWREAPGSASATFLISRYEQLREDLPMLDYRLFILRSVTVEPLVPLLRAACFDVGIDLEVGIGDFNTYTQEILNSDSSLYRFSPHAVVLMVDARDVAPDALSEDSGAEVDDAIFERVTTEFAELLRVFRKNTRAHLIVHALEERSLLEQATVVRRINAELRRMASEHFGIYVLDYDALVARHGRQTWHDEKKWLTVRLPIAASHLVDMVKEWMRFLHPLTGKIAKVLAVDLDNTLWGGVVGEDGPEGIHLSSENGGAPYQAVQRVMIDLKQRGVLLTICSKNNFADALEVIENHPHMLLRARDFAAMRINWNDKAHSLIELAAELGVGVESFAFLDDNPVERELVRNALPEVTVIELPNEPADFAPALRESPVFERLTISEEDLQRAEYYASQREREAERRGSRSIEDFFQSLQQEAEVSCLTPISSGRVAQLIQKTNQFNLTTHRYSEQQIAEMNQRDDFHVRTLRVRDRFGDNGLVGVAIVQAQDELWEIDTFLLSCRVIGRTLETALLSQVAKEARAHGAKQLRGRFVATAKNEAARNFYRDHGFRLVDHDESGSTWIIDLLRSEIECPEWIRLTIVNGDKH